LRILFVEKQIDYEPQGIMSLSSSLEAAGHEVALAICAQEDPLDVARKFEPGIVGYSVMTGSQNYYFELNQHLKESLKHPFFSAFGGPHPTFFPEMISEAGVDGLCIGEGEGAIVDLANRLDNGGPPPDLPNWWLKIDGEVVKNPTRPLVPALSDLPLPDRRLIYDKHAYTRESPIKHFLGGRGCPYNCTYCFNHAWYQIYERQKRGFQRSVDHVLDELEIVRERWPLEHVVFIDDLFIIYLDWLAEFADKYPRRIGLPFFCNVRANLVTPEKVALLKKAGCVTVSMGIEAANDRVRNDLLKRKMSREQMIHAGQLIRGGGVHLTSTNILGLPTSTLEDDLDTMSLNNECQVSYAHAFLFQPYPGHGAGGVHAGERPDGWQLRRHQRHRLGSVDHRTRRGREEPDRAPPALVRHGGRVPLADTPDSCADPAATQPVCRYALLVGAQTVEGLRHQETRAPDAAVPASAVERNHALHEAGSMREDISA